MLVQETQIKSMLILSRSVLLDLLPPVPEGFVHLLTAVML